MWNVRSIKTTSTWQLGIIEHRVANKERQLFDENNVGTHDNEVVIVLN